MCLNDFIDLRRTLVIVKLAVFKYINFHVAATIKTQIPFNLLSRCSLLKPIRFFKERPAKRNKSGTLEKLPIMEKVDTHTLFTIEAHSIFSACYAPANLLFQKLLSLIVSQ
jgi:hypothetical protein